MSRRAVPEGPASGQAGLAAEVSAGLGGGWVHDILALVRRRAGPGSHLTIAVLLAAILCICLRTGIMPLRSYVDDVVTMADNAWRLLCGQRPHADYSSALGTVSYLIWALGIKLAGGNLNGLAYGNSLAGISVGIWAYGLLARRVSGLLAVAGAAMLCLLALAPVQLGESYWMSSVAMSYNRLGYALLGLLIIESFPMRREEAARGVGGALSTGVVCAILLFLKANYFLVGLVLAAGSLVWTGRIERRRAAGLAAGFGAVALAILAYLRFDAGAMLTDLRMAADARSGAVAWGFVRGVFLSNFPGFLILAGLAATAQMAQRPAAGGGWAGQVHRLRPLALAGAVYVAGVLLLATNCQLERLPMQELLALLFLDCILQSSGADVRHTAVLCLMGMGLILGAQSTDELALLNGLRLKLHPPQGYAYPITGGGYAGAVFLDDYLETRDSARPYGRFLATYLTDGTDLLRRELHPGEKVTTMDNSNPFAFALRIEPASGGMSGAWYKYVFSDRFHLSADAFFGNADVVMFPKEHELPDENWRGLELYYIPEMERRFVQVAESAMWKMYRRRK
jgi:hypothetical protein